MSNTAKFSKLQRAKLVVREWLDLGWVTQETTKRLLAEFDDILLDVVLDDGPAYRNPMNAAETWIGRGRRPRWLQRELASGRSLADFSSDRGGA